MKTNPTDPTAEMRKIALDEWMQAGSGIKQRIQETLIDDQLQFDAYRVLERLAIAEGRALTLTTLSEQLSVGEDELFALLTQMSSNALIELLPGITHASYQVLLTHQGKRLYQKVDKRISVELTPIAAQFNAKELKLIRLILNKVRAVFSPVSAV